MRGRETQLLMYVTDLEDVMIYERLDKSSGNSKQSNKSMFHISKFAPLNSLDCVLLL